MCFYLSNYCSDYSLLSLGEVRRHIALEVEVSKLIGLLQLQKSLELGIRVNLATVLLVLEIVTTDVLVNLTSDISASHLSASGLLKELSKLIRNLGGLDETRGLTVSRLALALGISLLGSLNLTRPFLLKRAILSLQ